MWLPFTTVLTAVCLLLVEALTNRELEVKFQLRTPGEWEREWHQERYSRCRDSITRHLRWACEKDIYKLKRGESPDILRLKRIENEEEEEYEDENVVYPFYEPKTALAMLQTKRGMSKRSGVITQECCSPKGCTWEEYAEYCTQNNRKIPHKRYDYVSDY